MVSVLCLNFFNFPPRGGFCSLLCECGFLFYYLANGTCWHTPQNEIKEDKTDTIQNNNERELSITDGSLMLSFELAFCMYKVSLYTTLHY